MSNLNLLNVWPKRILCGLLSASLTLACASQQDLAKKSDYEKAKAFFASGKYEEARKSLPKNEKGGFITSNESLWTEWLYSKPDPWAYQSLAKSLDARKVIYVSKEAENFFFRETEEGYFPAEHEIVFFHILLGYAFAKTDDVVGACVEARQASAYLQDSFDETRKKFDDSGLRMWLAGLWLYCGDWEHAQVDIRVAGQILKRKDLIKISEREAPPKEFHIAFLGEGPEIVRKSGIDIDTAIDFNQIEFVSKNISRWTFSTEPIYAKAPEGKVKVDSNEEIIVITGSKKWYERHLQRNTKIRETLNQSKYMIASMGSSAKAVLHKGAAAAVATTLMTGGVVLGVLFIGGAIYLLVKLGASCGAGCGELIGAIVLAGGSLMIESTKSAEKIFKTESKSADDRLNEELDMTQSYRFVRFLPNYMVFALKESLSSRPTITEDKLGVKIEHDPLFSLASKKLTTKIHIYQWTP